jgi:hypothetical protein
MYAQEVHTYVICQNKKVSEIILLYNVYLAILTLTLEYRGTVTKLQAPFFSGTADWWIRMPNTSERLLKLHYLFILLLSSTSLHTEVWGNNKSESMSNSTSITQGSWGTKG